MRFIPSFMIICHFKSKSGKEGRGRQLHAHGCYVINMKSKISVKSQLSV
jgi:hypothetical protein